MNEQEEDSMDQLLHCWSSSVMYTALAHLNVRGSEMLMLDHHVAEYKKQVLLGWPGLQEGLRCLEPEVSDIDMVRRLWEIPMFMRNNIRRNLASSLRGQSNAEWLYFLYLLDDYSLQHLALETTDHRDLLKREDKELPDCWTS